MKRNVQILLLFACVVPLLVRAEEETMEARKRRITRKYLRERMDITYSEEVVPGGDAENEDILASEKFKLPEVDLERQQPGAQMPPPVRQPAPRTDNRNWLLSETAEPDDPYADPFAEKDSKDEPEKTDWTTWGTEREPSPFIGTQRESRFNGRDDESFSGQQAFESGLQPRTGGYTPYKSPYQTQREQQQEQWGGYTPYKSPYQTQREQQQEQWGGYSEPKQEYRRQDPYQQWKKKNPVPFNPMSDDAFIQETMPKTRR